MAELILYEHPLSPYAQKVKISLREKDVPFAARLPEGIGTGATGGGFAKANPRGEVPALIHGDVQIFDSTIILEYIEDVWPEPAMLPRAAAERARVRMIEDVMDTQFEAITWGLGELNFFRRAEGAQKDAMEAKARQQAEAFFGVLEGYLGDREWFNGGRFGWGDLSVVPYLNGAAGFGIRPAAGSRLAAWLDRANVRESVAQAQRESVASITGMNQVDQAVKAGLFKRQYRDHRLEWMMKTGGTDIVLKGLEAGNIRFTGPGT
ncbi:glutathione S-transferase [Hyphomonas polymorpha PS728]|uniref:Glutathione S-transferase n=1 Tax=Hyphomonas polymorpha PS728 TaxID=1280954 RepID=A0A062VC86_9PROT|nr:glutathione S-transferase family protein [Hyphomonas polymorpha]KCZ96985.1 glutathione S-transferase [Hyphomonas polymorpha PS728]